MASGKFVFGLFYSYFTERIWIANSIFSSLTTVPLIGVAIPGSIYTVAAEHRIVKYNGSLPGAVEK